MSIHSSVVIELLHRVDGEVACVLSIPGREGTAHRTWKPLPESGGRLSYGQLLDLQSWIVTSVQNWLSVAAGTQEQLFQPYTD